MSVMQRRAAVALALLLAAGAGRAQPVADRLDALHAFLAESTGVGGYAGAVELLMRDGRIVDFRAFGHRDLARREPMTRDAIFRIYSMTKTIATAALLMLVDEGRLGLDDPVARYLPAFGALVVDDGTGSTRPPRRPMTMRHLLTHSAGFALGPAAPPAAARALAEADPSGATDLAGYAERASRAPLGFDPGARFHYDGLSTEIACRIVEVIAGEPFDGFLQRRILGPLRMADTGFEVAAAQRHRIAEISAIGAGGARVAALVPAAGTRMRPYPSGAGGLYSTAADYARFAQMLLNRGTLDGVTILRRETVDLMLGNQLTQTDPAPGLAGNEFRPGEGFGLGGSVRIAADGGRPAGAFGWTGAASTYYSIDPRQRLVAILLLQHLPKDGAGDLPKLQSRFYELAHRALVP